MGSSSWNDDFYKDRVKTRAATNTPAFHYDAKVRSGAVATKVHDNLNVFGKIRESRDSAEHPDSVAIAVLFDVTGSMGSVPRKLQEKLPQLMGLLLRKGYIKDPQVLFGGIGDYIADKVPLQVGQFESGVEMDDDVTKLYLEGGGGGQKTESYQDAMYFMAHRTAIDCFEKRGKKGYLFIIGDELPFTSSPENELLTLLGREAQSPDGSFKHVIEGGASVEQIAEDLQKRYECFFIIPQGSGYYNDNQIRETWSRLFGAERFIKLDDPAAVCETIGMTIGLLEGTITGDEITDNLKDVGAGTAIVSAVTKGLDDLAKSTALAKVGTGDLPEKSGRSDAVERL